MEIINIEAGTYRAMMERFEQFVRRIEDLCDRNSDRSMGEWLDTGDVCTILCIGKRTLQTLRDTGKLAYTMFGYKSFYKPEDVVKLITKPSNAEEPE